MDNEQYSNMVDVEGFINQNKENNNAVDEKMKENLVSNKKNSLLKFIAILFICLGTLIIISYLGATLLFFIWSIGITDCSKDGTKNLFEYIFPISCDGEEFCKNQNVNYGNVENNKNFEGGSSNFKDIKNCLNNNKDLKDFCNQKNIKLDDTNWNNPGMYEWFLKTFKETNYLINTVLINILKVLPNNDFCGITFIFAWLFYIILFIISITILPFISGLIFFFKYIWNGTDYFLKNNKSDIILRYLKLLIGFFITFLVPIPFSLPLLLGSAIGISLMFKMLFYPLVLGAGDIILKIINQNLFIIKLLLIIISIIFVTLLNNNVNKSVFYGILIGYIPLLIYNIWNLI